MCVHRSFTSIFFICLYQLSFSFHLWPYTYLLVFQACCVILYGLEVAHSEGVLESFHGWMCQPPVVTMRQHAGRVRHGLSMRHADLFIDSPGLGCVCVLRHSAVSNSFQPHGL